MSIRCVCPNGHVLNVNVLLAGTSGLCPTCKARVKVPHLRDQHVSEDAILDMLGPREPAPQAVAVAQSQPVQAVAASQSSSQERGTPKKNCYKCNQEIPAGTHVCPHCHTYIAKLDDF